MWLWLAEQPADRSCPEKTNKKVAHADEGSLSFWPCLVPLFLFFLCAVTTVRVLEHFSIEWPAAMILALSRAGSDVILCRDCPPSPHPPLSYYNDYYHCCRHVCLFLAYLWPSVDQSLPFDIDTERKGDRCSSSCVVGGIFHI